MSFGWGIASYSFAMRLITKNAEKGKLSWAGYILQSIWRFGMLSARIIALVLLSLALGEYTVIVMCKYNFNLFCVADNNLKGFNIIFLPLINECFV